MDVLHIRGAQPLNGRIEVSGAKNAALPILAASLLTDEPVIIQNVPNLSDVHFMADILKALGAEVELLSDRSYRICARTITHRAPYELVRKMRASICVLGPLVGRLRRAEVSLPGGCVIGHRPIDLHLKGLGKLGVDISIERGYVIADGKALHGARVFLGGRHGSTVTGTANLLMAAVLTPGCTEIESAACEPEIMDLCHLLIAMGAKIDGVGSHHLKIEGVPALHGCTHSIVADRIEAGTFLVAAAITGGEITLTGAKPSHLSAFLDKLEEIGVALSINPAGEITVLKPRGTRRPVEIITMPHPGFPTDLQAQMCALLSLTPGLSIVTERIYPNRFMHIPELQRMGADIAIEGANAIINGRERLSGAPVMASDLRASAALLLAALAADGETWVQRIYHLDRGYERIEEKLNAVGALITRLPATEMPNDLREPF